MAFLRPLGTVAAYLRMFGAMGVPHLLFCLVSRRRKRVRVSARWSRHPVFVRLNTSDINVFRQVFLEEEYAITRLDGHRYATIVDAGANIGLTSVWLAERHPDARIFAIEPDAGNFELLQRNTAAYGRIQCARGALWNRDQPLSLDRAHRDWAFQVKPAAPVAPAPVEGWRLSTFMQRNGIERVSLLKLDIEGAEYEVLSDAAWWIGSVDSIVAELHESLRPGCQALFDEATRGFRKLATSRELTLVTREGG